jgi:hypothetical protein
MLSYPYSTPKRQASTLGLQLTVPKWNLTLLVGHIVQFAGDRVRHIAELLFLLVAVLARSGRRVLR